MHAIGNRIIENNPNAKVLYVTSEKFTNQLVNAIQENKNEIFRNKYRTIDVLLIDDIQFIAGKKQLLYMKIKNKLLFLVIEIQMIFHF